MPMGTAITPLSESHAGTFVGQADLGMGGHWRLQLLVFQPSGLSRLSIDIQVGA